MLKRIEEIEDGRDYWVYGMIVPYKWHWYIAKRNLKHSLQQSRKNELRLLYKPNDTVENVWRL